VITPACYDSRTKYASTLRVIHYLSFVNCLWLQVKIRNGELDKTERSNDSNMYSHENRITLRWIDGPNSDSHSVITDVYIFTIDL